MERAVSVTPSCPTSNNVSWPLSVQSGFINNSNIRRPKCRQPQLSSSRAHRIRFGLENSGEEVLNNVSLALLSGLLDAFNLLLSLLVGLVLRLLVALAVLDVRRVSTGRVPCPCRRTSASNSLNSSSFLALYSAISFLASSRASFTRWVRTGNQVGKELLVTAAIEGLARMGSHILELHRAKG